MARRVLLTGFEPFGGAPRNPSGDAARALDGRVLSREAAGCPTARLGEVMGRVLPVLWDVAAAELLTLVRQARPHVVVCLGMAHATFRVERFADDVRRATEDNAGNLPSPLRIEPTTRLPTSLPTPRVEAAIAAAGGPIERSEDAGGFICNNVFFALMQAYHAGACPGLLRAGFIHVPNDAHVPDRIPQDVVDAAIEAALAVTLDDIPEDEDVAVYMP